MATYFSDFFKIDPRLLEQYGAVNISLVTDLPLFIDPFLLFNSDNANYQKLHNQMIEYLRFLHEKSESEDIDDTQIQSWYCFKEIKQTWLGFSKSGNRGHGLGMDFGRSLHANLHKIFHDNTKRIGLRTNHLEKVGLIKGGVGRDNISDFTTNLIKHFLCTYTQKFAVAHISQKKRKKVAVPKASFNYETETWKTITYELPYINGDYVIIVPKDILTRDEYWINNQDLYDQFSDIPASIPDTQLRNQISNYFNRKLHPRPDHHPTKEERHAAIQETIDEFPVLIDYFIKLKESRSEEATEVSAEKVRNALAFFVNKTLGLQNILAEQTQFYKIAGDTYTEAHQRAAFLKDVIENKGGHHLFYIDGEPIKREADLQILYRLVWFGTPSDVSREVNDGRGPADFKISRGAHDKTIVEMKLGKNTHLEANIKSQAEIYQKASDAKRAIKIILYFSPAEKTRVERILLKHGLLEHYDIILIDAQRGNKPTGSKA